jgi:hypothetical protein
LFKDEDYGEQVVARAQVVFKAADENPPGVWSYEELN